MFLAAAVFGIPELGKRTQVFSDGRHHLLRFLKHVDVDVKYRHVGCVTVAEMVVCAIIRIGDNVFNLVAMAPDN